MDKVRIQSSFSDAANSYDQHARIQKEVAFQLAQATTRQWPQVQHVLEIGCGTGNLSQLLLENYRQARFVLSDISSSMLEACQLKLSDFDRQRVELRCVDGEQLNATGFDLVASSLAFQWFSDQLPTLTRLIGQSNRLAVATLLDGTFQEWRAAHQQLGFEDGVQSFLTEAALRSWADQHRATVTTLTLTESFASARDFVRSLKGIGAVTPKPGHEPAPLLKILRQFPHGITVTYRVGMIFFER